MLTQVSQRHTGSAYTAWANEAIGPRADLNAGQLWSEVLQELFSQMTLWDYADKLHLAYKWRRLCRNNWSLTGLVPPA